MMKVTLVCPYNTAWPEWFELLKSRVESALIGLPHTVEHVGSTAVPGMVAKPIIDIDIVIERNDFRRVRQKLAALGYTHQGDKGIPDREAFDLENEAARRSLPAHHLYVCMRGAPELHKHLVFRDFMRRNPQWVRKLSEHKVILCEKHGNDRQAYIDGKAEMVRRIAELAEKESRTGA